MEEIKENNHDSQMNKVNLKRSTFKLNSRNKTQKIKDLKLNKTQKKKKSLTKLKINSPVNKK